MRIKSDVCTTTVPIVTIGGDVSHREKSCFVATANYDHPRVKAERKQGLLMKRILGLRATIIAGLMLASPANADTNEDRLKELANLFASADVVGEPKIVDCTLSHGTKSSCLSITVIAAPGNHETGPFCPKMITDSADSGGTWIKDGEVYDVDGKFIENLATFYDDDEWQMFDPKTGKVTLVDGKLGCEVAGDPTSADRYKNTCVECDVEFMGSEDVTQTYVIPLRPTEFFWRAKGIDRSTGIGLALNGVKFDAPAPLHLILGGHTLGPFDDCGGHGNPHGGYHYHGVAGCETQVEGDDKDHAPIVGLSMDGYTIHTQANKNGKEPDDLDRCRGHEIAGLGYHFHASGPGDNQIIGCYASETGCVLDDPDEKCDASAPKKKGRP